jgi:hypothetical protein
MTTKTGAILDATTEASVIPSSDGCAGGGLNALLERDVGFGTHHWRMHVKRLLRLAAAGLFLGQLAAVEPDEIGAARQAVDQLVKAIGNLPEIEVLRLRAEVEKAGTEAVKHVGSLWSDLSERVRGGLLHAIWRIPGEEADEILLNAALQSNGRELSLIALGRLSERAEAGNLRIRVGPEDWGLILERVRRGEDPGAVVWAMVACRLQGVPQDELADAMVTGLRRKIAAPSQEQGRPGWVSYMSPGVNWNSLFIREATQVETEYMLPRLRRAAVESKDETELMWLRIALGRCGAPEVKEEMLRLVEDTSLETSLRAEALRAYVGAAGQEAVPVLLKYKDDQTREPAWLAGPPLGIVAHDQLARLQAGATSVPE